MKWTFSTEGDWGDDRHIMFDLVRAQSMSSAIHEALNKIRSRLKYGENVSQHEERNLEEIRSILLDINEDS